jgi:predicted dinucleotide-binding enzyme
MEICIIGKGKVGGALGQALTKAGHTVRYSERHTVAESARGADAVIVAAVPPATLDIAAALAPVIGNAVVIDAMNSVSRRLEGYPTTTHAFQALLPGARVVKCFNSVGFEVMADPNVGGTRADMFMAGDDVGAKVIASQLARDCGFGACHDVGGSDRFESLEHLAMIWISLAMKQGKGRSFAWHLIER